MTRRSPSQYVWGKLRFDEQLMRKHFTRQSSKNVRFIVVHHMTIVGNGKGSALDACYRVWQSREASAQYGVDGKYVRQFVWDKDYAWAAGDYVGNRDGIHIEHANSTAGPKWLVSQTTWKTGARLAAQLHYEYKLGRPVKDRTLRKHSSFYATACPGPYLGHKIWNKYVKEVQHQYDLLTGKAKPKPKPKPKPKEWDEMASKSEIKAAFREVLGEQLIKTPQPLIDRGWSKTKSIRSALYAQWTFLEDISAMLQHRGPYEKDKE